MARPVTNKIREYVVKVKQKNGDTYVLQRQARYDSEKGYAITVSEKLIGKIPKGETEIIPTRAKRKNDTENPAPSTESANSISASRSYVGMLEILEWVGEATGIDKALKKAFPEEADALKVISLARYLVASDGDSLPKIEEFCLTHKLPYNDISEDIYHDLFQKIGINEDIIQKYNNERARELSYDNCIAFDSTTCSTYSSRLKQARYGYNKDFEKLPCFKVITLYSIKDKQPIAFTTQPGNISDVISVTNALKEIDFLDIKNFTFIMDNGFYSEKNIISLYLNSINFLLLANKNIKFIKDQVDLSLDELNNGESICQFDDDIRLTSKQVEKKFSGEIDGKKVEITKNINIHIYKSRDRSYLYAKKIDQKISSIRRKLQDNIYDFSVDENTIIENFYKKEEYDGNFRYTFNNKSYYEALNKSGIFTLVSNNFNDADSALKWYRLRENIEDFFCLLKNNANGKRARVWSDEVLRGKLFVQFIALSYYLFLYNKIEDVKTNLINDIKDVNTTKTNRDKLKNLSNWISHKSLSQILIWFDCRYEMTVKSSKGQSRWSSEITARDSLFLERLGVTIHN